MNCGNDCERKKDLKNCLIQLDLLFQWLAAVENKPIEKDDTEMGSNFAKYKIIPEYEEFIQPACNAEKHFGDKDYPVCAERCRNSMQLFIEYLYTKFGWKKPIGKSNPAKPSLDELIRDLNIQNFLEKKGAGSYTYSKKYGNDATHEPFYNTDENDAFKCLSDLFYLITKSLFENDPEKKSFAGTQRFDPSLLVNCPKELIEPQLEIEFVEISSHNKEEIIPQNILQNDLLKAVRSKNISENLIKENLSLIDKTDVLGNTPLSLAVYNDDFGTVKMLLENGADPNFYFRNGSVDFHKSVNEEITKEIAQNVHLRDALRKENTSLINFETLEKLLANRVWAGYIDAHRCIPLIVAIKKDNVDIVRLLLQYSARTWDSWIGTDKRYIVERLPSECSTLLTCAIFYNATKCLRMLLKDEIIENNGKKIEVSIDPERVDSENVYNSRKLYGTIEGVTALMLASEKGNFDVVDQLLDKGARIDSYDECNNSVFLHAVQDKREKNVLGKLLRTAKNTLGEEKTKEIVNHSGSAGCPISYVDKEDDADLLLEYGADVNAKNEKGDSCIVDVVHISPKLLPWFKKNGAKFDIRTFFYNNSYLDFKYADKASVNYSEKCISEVLNALSDFITLNDLNFTVPIDNVPRITPLVDAILFSKVKNIQNATEFGKEKTEKEFLSDAQLKELHDKYPVIKELSKIGENISSYSQVNEKYNIFEKWVNEGLPTNNEAASNPVSRKVNHLLTGILRLFPFVPNNAFETGSNSQKELTVAEVENLPKLKLDFNIDMTLEDVHRAIASVKELSRKQRIALFKKYPFIKQLEMRGIDLNVPEEIESQYNTEWEMSSDEILTAIRNIKYEIPYEDVKISPLDDALIAAIADIKGIKAKVSECETLGALLKELRKALEEQDDVKASSIYKALEELLEVLEVLEKHDTKKKTVREKINDAIRGVTATIENVKAEISNYESLVADYFDASTIYLTKGIKVSELTEILLLIVHDVPKKDTSAWNKVQVALKLRKDIDFSDVLFRLCKNHPKYDFDIAEEFINNGYNFYRFANYNLVDFWRETYASTVSDSNYYKNCMYPIENEDGTYNASPSIEDVRKRNNSSFLKNFGETDFKKVNLGLIRNAISFGANPHEQDEIHKTALDYAKENGIDERELKVRPSVQKGVICKIQSDKTDKTKIFNGQVRGTTDGRLYNFKKRIHDKNFKEVVYDDSYKEKTVFFVIQKDSKDPVHPGLADLVTLVDS